jgi:hypothetical protein
VSRPPWWAGLAAAETRLDCGGQPHRLRWSAGQLTTPDHTEDLEGEQILSALGGQSYPCLDVLDLWAGHAADLRVLILASRGPADPLATGTPPQPGRTGYTARGFAGRRGRPAGSFAMLTHGQPDDPDDGLPRLIGLGGLLPDRLAATVIATWAGRLRGPAGDGPAPPGTSAVRTSGAGAAAAGAAAGAAGAHAVTADELAAARPALHAALYGRAVTALRSWTGRRELAVALTMIPEDQPPRLARDGDGIAAELPFGWLADVWSRGLATCWGRFCLTAVPDPSGDGWLLSTVGPELDSPRPVTLSAPPSS